MGGPSRRPELKVGLSTALVIPDGLEAAFRAAAELGYDGVELMVFTDPESQSVERVAELSETYAVPVLSVHSPCLLVTQTVWGRDPWVKLARSVATAEELGASAVVVHPPFRWQREYARGFVEGVARVQADTSVTVAVENMFPWRVGRREIIAYAPGWDPVAETYPSITLDLSHAAVAQQSGLELARALGDRLVHLHLADGSGSRSDEHLIPGRGTQPCAEVLSELAGNGYVGHVILEVSTRRAATPEDRRADLAEALAFARDHLAGDG